MPTSIAIVDDHHLVAAALSDLIRKFENYDVLLVAENGRDLLDQLAANSNLPDIVLLDMMMPVMGGFETLVQLQQLYPTIRVLVLSMEDQEEKIVRMVRHGARGYLLKESRPAELRQALDDVMEKEFYSSDFLTGHLISNLNKPAEKASVPHVSLNAREHEFLKFACSELTYNEIATKMTVSPRTIDGYREIVFQKMNVKTRVGMVIEAVRHKLIEL